MKNIHKEKHLTGILLLAVFFALGCSSVKTGDLLLSLDTRTLDMAAPNRAEDLNHSKILSVDLSRLNLSPAASATSFANAEVETLYLHADFDYAARQGTITGVEIGKYRIAARVIDQSNGAIVSVGYSDAFTVSDGAETVVKISFTSSSGSSTPLAIPLFGSSISSLNTNAAAVSALAAVSAMKTLSDQPKNLIDYFKNAPSPTQSTDGGTVWSYTAGTMQYIFAYTPKATGGNSFVYQTKNGEAKPITVMSGTTELANANASLDLFDSATTCKTLSLSWTQSNGNLTASLSSFPDPIEGVCSKAATISYSYALNGSDSSGSLRQTNSNGGGLNILWKKDGSGTLETIDTLGKTTKSESWAS